MESTPQSTLRDVDNEPKTTTNPQMKKQPLSSWKERHTHHPVPPTAVMDQDTGLLNILKGIYFIELLDDSSEVIQLLAEYERNINQRKREVEKVHQQREEMKEVEKMLQDLQVRL